MEMELELLYEELEKVKSSPLEYLPEYGFSPKSEIIKLINEDISDIEESFQPESSNYTEEELENERLSLCLSQGISRYC